MFLILLKEGQINFALEGLQYWPIYGNITEGGTPGIHLHRRDFTGGCAVMIRADQNNSFNGVWYKLRKIGGGHMAAKKMTCMRRDQADEFALKVGGWRLLK